MWHVVKLFKNNALMLKKEYNVSDSSYLQRLTNPHATTTI